jgi:hypothetical protein
MSQTLVLVGPSGLATSTVRVFPESSGTAVSGSPFTLTEDSTRKGYYSATVSTNLTGDHYCVFYSGAYPVGSGWASLLASDGTYYVQAESPSTVLSAAEVWTYSTRTLSSMVPSVPPGSPPPPPGPGWSAAIVYCTNSEFLARYDARRVGDLLSDSGEAIATGDLPSNGVLTELLGDASSLILSAASVANRYTPADLAGFLETNHPARRLLIRLVADLAFGLLLKRRGYDAAAISSMAPGYLEGLQTLDLIRKGERIFPAEAFAVEGTPKHSSFPNPPGTPRLVTTQTRIFPGYP